MPNAWRSIFAAAVLALSLGEAAYAQVAPPVVPTVPVPAKPAIKLTMADQHVMREWLLKQNGLKPQAVKFDIVRGGTVPADVTLHPFPDEVTNKIRQLKPHRFFLTDDTIVVVEPQARTIVEVVK